MNETWEWVRELGAMPEASNEEMERRRGERRRAFEEHLRGFDEKWGHGVTADGEQEQE